MNTVLLVFLTTFLTAVSFASDKKEPQRKVSTTLKCKIGERPSYIDKREGGPGAGCEKIAVACLDDAKAAATQVLAKASEGTGINSLMKISTVPLSDGALFVFPAFIQKMFDYQVIVVVNQACEVKNTFINGQ